MKKIAIMQPYFLPYIGYWQLINAVDEFIILDDVNFIMRGFINRNKILLNKKAYLFSIPLEKASQNKLINEIKLKFLNSEKESFLKTITFAYKKAKYFKDIYPIIERIITNSEEDLTKYIKFSIENINDYLGINTVINYSSDIKKDKTLKAQSMIIEICKTLNADIYVNAIGGQELYDKNVFEKEGIQLNFIKTGPLSYTQFNNSFVENLSILDILMFNSKYDIMEMLEKYELI